MKISRSIFLGVAVVLVLPPLSYATPQIPDTVKHNEMVSPWHGDGLSPVLQDRGVRFIPPHTACWDGYIAQWRIRGKKLFLINLLAWVKDETDKACGMKKVGIEYLFPGRKAVFADWFSGEMILIESESKMKKDLIVDCIYWRFVFHSGTVIGSERRTEKFDMNDPKQFKRYHLLFRKSPERYIEPKDDLL